MGPADGDEVDLGELRLQTLATPGHPHEHVSFLLLDGSRPLGVFTGGSLLVGAGARTDLVDQDQTEQLARMQCRSLRRLAALRDDVAVWPTQGAGSVCSAPPGTDRVSIIGREKATNPLLAKASEDEFVAALLGGLLGYCRHLAEQNRRGTAVLAGPPVLRALTVSEVRKCLAGGGVIVDVQAVAAFAESHARRALSIPLGPAFAAWLG